MHLVSYHADPAAGPAIRAGVLRDGRVYDLAALADGLPTDLIDFFGLGADGLRRADEGLRRAGTTPVAAPRLAAPIPRPGKVLCVGLNYADHAREIGLTPEATPVIFAKLPTSVVGPDDPVELCHESTQIDYEAELVAVVGRTARRVGRETALSHLAGLTCGNDVTARDWQFDAPSGQWTLGKSFDGFAPLGPAIVTTDELPPDRPLDISLTLNGVTRQQSNTREFLFDLATVLAHISRVVTLEPGDLIFTGTPAGIGYTQRPQIFLAPGDVTDVAIEGIGTLRTTFVADPRGAAGASASVGVRADAR